MNLDKSLPVNWIKAIVGNFLLWLEPRNFVMIPSKSPQRLLIFAFIFILLVGCYPGSSSLSPASITPITAPVARAIPKVSDRPDGFSEEQFDTLSSLELVGDFPLYTMYYYADYQTAYSEELNNKSTVTGEILLPPNWACSLFAALADTQGGTYGRNFDWEFSPALLLFTHPPDGYASVSMVNLAFIRNWGDEVEQLTELPVEQREALLRAPFLPIDGMNEFGLVVGMAAVPHRPILNLPGKESIGSLGVIRQVLDHARDVDEAVTILGSYNIDWGGGPPIHYLVADRSGRAALVEFYEDEMVVFPNERPWHQATNFLRASAGDSEEGNCWRYEVISQSLENTGGLVTTEQALQLLADVSQAGTQWSIVYGLHSGDVTVAMGRDYAEPHTFQLDLLDE